MQGQEAVGVQGGMPDIHAVDILMVGEGVQRGVEKDGRHIGRKNRTQLAEGFLPLRFAEGLADLREQRICLKRGVL